MVDKLQTANKVLKDLEALKQAAIILSRTSSSIDELTQEIASLERDLSKTGSTKTAAQLKEELDELSLKL